MTDNQKIKNRDILERLSDLQKLIKEESVIKEICNIIKYNIYNVI